MPIGDESFTTNLRRLRRASGYTQESFAERLNLSLRGYQKYEQGLTAPNSHMIKRIAEALECDPGDLFGDLETVRKGSAKAPADRLSAADIAGWAISTPKAGGISLPGFMEGMPLEKALIILTELKEPISKIYGLRAVDGRLRDFIHAWEKAKPSAQDAALLVLQTSLPEDDPASAAAHQDHPKKAK